MGKKKKVKGTLKLPKRVGGVKLPKKLRKAANGLLASFEKPELDAVAALVLGAIVNHYKDRLVGGSETALKGGKAKPAVTQQRPPLRRCPSVGGSGGRG